MKLFNDRLILKILTKQRSTSSFQGNYPSDNFNAFNYLVESNKFELVVRNQYNTKIKLYPTLAATPIETFLELNLKEIIKNLLFITFLSVRGVLESNQ